MARLVEGLWDCPYCDTKQIKGSLRECQNCGRARDENTKFYLPSQINYVSEENSTRINRNPDWICPYCNSLNSDSNSVCESCGSSRTSENLDYFSHKKKQEEEHRSQTEEYASDDSSDNSYDNKFMSTILKPRSARSKKKPWKIVISIFMVLALFTGLVLLLIPKNEQITITGFEWERFIRIERYQTIQESSWTLPTEARLLYSKEEISHYISVIDHYETRTKQVEKQRIAGYEEYVSGYKDLGNGYFEEIISKRPIYEVYYETEYYKEPVYVQQPVYQTKYYYEIDKWIYERTIESKGKDKEPYWAEEILFDDERISEKIENYYIVGINKKDKVKKIKLSYEDWTNLEIGQTVKLKVSLLGFGELVK